MYISPADEEIGSSIGKRSQMVLILGPEKLFSEIGSKINDFDDRKSVFISAATLAA